MSRQKAIIFGTGKLYKRKEDYIRAQFQIICYLDNKAADDEVKFEGTDIPVCNPQNIVQYIQSDVLFVLMSYEYVSMWKQLYKFGVNEKNILFGIMLPPFTENEKILFLDDRYLAAEGSNIVYYYDKDRKVVIEDHQQIRDIAKELLREQYKEEYPIIRAIAQMDSKPISRIFGVERGTAIDRYYIESFLKNNKQLIYGDCLEIAENMYTLKYGEDRIRNSYILHLEGWGNGAIKGNLETGEGIKNAGYDCVIITQTLMYTFDIHSVAENIYKLLKKGGNALLTVSGISQISRYDADLWGSYYGFHKDAMRKLFCPLFGEENVVIHSYGNVKTVTAMLCGLCREDLCEDDFRIEDEDYPMIISIVLKKR